MKKHLLTRFLSFTLAFTILSSDISVYAASDIVEEPTTQTEEMAEEDFDTEISEKNTEELLESETSLEETEPVEDTIIIEAPTAEEPAVEEPVEETQEIIKGTLDDIRYLVPETETAAAAIGMYTLTDGQVSLKDSNEVEWIDRLDLTDAAEIRTFYDKLVEAADNDGEDDFLIEDAYFSEDYDLTVAEVTETIEVELSNVSDEAVVESEIEAAVAAGAGKIEQNYSPYMLAARDAFDRDHPEIFWLSGEAAFGYGVSYQYQVSTAEEKKAKVEYKVTLYMVLTGTVEEETFDVRADGYQSQDAIKAAISNVNSACNEILEAVSSLSDYEKIKYFNDILTKSNEYNTSTDLTSIGHDCRECVSALEGRTGTAGPVCEGYARAMKVLCDKAGIPCVLESGTAYNSSESAGEAHMWNHIQLDGSWYGVDVTWNDPLGGSGVESGYEGEEWLLLGSDTVVDEMTFSQSHVAENIVSMGGVAFTNGPQLSSEKYVYSEGEGENSGTGDEETGTQDKNTIYKISFEVNGGTINSGNVTEYDGKTVVTLPTDVTKEGYTFAGWYETEAFEGESITEIPSGSAQDKVFYAKWEAEEKEEEKIHTGYFVYEDEKYYADSNGVLQSGWVKIGTDWHYFDKESGCKELEYETDGYLYILENGSISYFTNKTTLLKNSWLTYSSARYFFDEEGFAVKGWHQDGTYWYYADENSKMANKEIEIGEETYYFDSSYHLSTGWKKINGVYRYFNVDEDHEKCHEITMDGTTGWVNLEDGRRAYIDASAGAVTGWKTLNGYRYHFNSEGFVDTGLFQDGRYYYYAETKDTATTDSPIGNVVKGVKTIDGKTYGFHTSQYYRLTGWQTLNGERYYFQDDCSAVIGWYEEGNYRYYANADGCMAKGPTEIGKQTYYFDNNYRLVTGWYTIDGQKYYLNHDGRIATGEFTVGNYTYYAYSDGTLAKGLTTIDGETCLFHTSSYYRLTGWQTVNGKRFFFNSDGKAETGLFETGGKKYYAESASDEAKAIIRGEVVTGRKEVGDNIYVFHSSQYYMLTGWQTVNGQRYYLQEDGTAVVNEWYQEGDYWYHADENGCMAKGLVTIDEKKYYFDSNYRLTTGWKQIDGVMYFFDSVAEDPEKCYALDYTAEAGGWITFKADGRKSYINAKKQVLTGWQNIDGKRYYFDGSGIMETGLFQIGRYYYYADADGRIATGAKEIDGKIYGFHPTQYYRLTGWQTLNGERYFFRDDCSAVIGWYQEGNYWYYADVEGRMLKGVKAIGEQTYYFDNNYRLTTGWVKLDNVWRFFDNAENYLDCHELTYTNRDGWLTLKEEAARKSYVNASNSLLKGWQTISGQRYYFDSVGIMETGEFKVGNYWYYAEPKDVVEDNVLVTPQGAVAKGIKVIGGETYLFHTSSYYRLSGWQTMNGKRFFLDSEGKATVGLFENDGRKYYAETASDEENGIIEGMVVTGRKQVGDETYVFHPSQYYMLTGWQTVNGQRYYLKEDGSAIVNEWYQEGDYWYHADENGYMAKGLVIIGDQQYYFDNNYRLSTGWKQIDGEMYFFDSVAEEPEKCCALEYDGEAGGWVTVKADGRKSYINAKKQVLTGWQTIDKKRYYFDGSGIMETGLFQIGRYYYYAEEAETAAAESPEGSIATGAKTIDGKVYGFHPTQYYRLTGWQTLNGERYFFQDDCSAVIGWYQEGNYWYYADAQGRILKGAQEIEIPAQSEEEISEIHTYYFDSNYRLTTGWVKLDGRWRYFNSSEIPKECYELTSDDAASGWITLNNGKKSYIHSKNGILKGWQTIDNQRYYFDNAGIMQTGWFEIGGCWYYANEDGCVLKGTHIIDERTYYFDGNYRLTTGWIKLENVWRFFENAEEHLECYERSYTQSNGWLTLEADGRKSYVNSSNNLLKGWQTIDGQRYYFDNIGIMKTDWFQVGSYWYYADEEGIVAKGAKEMDGKVYGFHPSQYYRLSGWQTLNGQRYYFQENYQAVTGWYQEGDYWYYADENGCMSQYLTKIGENEYYFDANYRLSTGWKRIGNEMYFFDSVAEEPEKCNALIHTEKINNWVTLPDGRKSYINAKYQVLTGWQTIDGKRYYFDGSGIMETGLFQIGRYYYYAEEARTATPASPEGSIATGAKTVDGKVYGFHPTQYYRLTGWQTLNGERYFFQDDCSAVVGWYQEGNYWYYADTEGRMLKGVKEIVAQTTDGQKAEKQIYYFDNNYRLTTGWVKLDNVWRFFDNAENYLDCHELTYTNKEGWLTLNEEAARKSYVNASGSLLKGWQTISGQRYYFDSVGIMETGEFKVGNYWYYAETTSDEESDIIRGMVVTGRKQIGNITYVFHPSQYYMLTGWQTVNGQRYYIKEDGSAIVNAWYQEGDYWYHADENGYMAKGLVTIGEKQYYFDNNYRLSTGWKRIGNTMYFFDSVAEQPEACCALLQTDAIGDWVVWPDGRKSYINTKYQVLTGWQTIGGKRYYFDGSGIMETGLFQNGRYYYYAEEAETAAAESPKGSIATGAKEIDGMIYGFHPTQYYRLTGWQTLDSQRYYFQDDCSAVIGWYQEGNYWYYSNTQGQMQKGEQTIDDKIYYFDSNYRLTTGWVKLDGEWRYFNDSEAPKECYELTSDRANSGWITLENGRKSYIHSRNGILKGWQTIDGNRYYFDAKGIAETGEFKVGNYWYYADKECVVLKGWQTIAGKTYYFHTSSYYRMNGWQTISSQRYYFDSNGVMQTGWFAIGDYWYYADADGKVQKNLVKILTDNAERTYYFDGNYRLKTGWYTISGVKYHFHGAEKPQDCYAIYSGSVTKGWFTFDGGKSYFNNSLNAVTGWQTIDGKRYYFDVNGIMQIGWFKVGDYWYYAHSTGTAANGKLELKVGEETKTYYFDENYRLQTGWQTINGKKYYIEIADTPKNYSLTYVASVVEGWQTLENSKIFYADKYGNIKTGWQTIDGNRYYFDATGALQTGMFKVGNYWYYGEEKAAESLQQTIPVGAVAKGIKEINGKTYVFHTSSYYRLTGWQTVGGQRFYLDSDGVAKTNWFTVGNYTYYGETETHDGIYRGTVAKGAKEISGETYFFHSSQYYMLTGFQSYGGMRYYLQKDGKARTGWFTVGTDLYYGEPTASEEILKGTLASGAKEIDGKTYFFHTSSNYRLTGWQTVNGQRYYLDIDGTARTGWFTISGKIYYGEPVTTSELLQGTLAKGAKEINGETYCFHSSSYYRLTGWQTVNNQRYYLDTDGKARTGWFKVGGYDYYAESNGNVVKGLVELPYGSEGEKKTYYFDSNYRLKTGWQTISGKKYFFKNAEKPEECYATNTVVEIKTGWLELETGQICYMNSKGTILTGWQTIDKQRYYFDANGVLQTDWFKVGNYWYYGEEKAAEGSEQTIPVGAVAKGIKEIDGKTYVFHTNSYYRLSGWQTVSGQRFYLETDGTAKTGWFTVGTDLYYGEPTTSEDGILKGTLAKGAKEIDGETYFFHTSSNYRLTGWQTVNGQRYYLDANGKAKTGWFTIGGKIYYGEPETTGTTLKGTLAKGAKTIGNETYVFHTSNYYRLTGWQTANSQRYYLDTDGTARTGWFTISGKNYYAQPEAKADGTLKGTVAKGLTEITEIVDGKEITKTYYFHPSQYYMLKGWQTINKERYYFNEDGTVKTGWFEVSGKKYYADAAGVVAKGAKEISGETYYFHSSQYYMLTGFQSYDGKRYYIQKNGTAKTGWFTVGTDLYYGEPSTTEAGILKGTLASGAKEIDGETYFFHASSNYRLTGWQTVSGQRYYLDADGTARTGWFTLSEKIYYGEPETTGSTLKGTLAKGAKTIGNKTYVFHISSYYRLTGWQTANSQRYYLDTDGTARTGWFTVGGYYYYAESDGCVVKGLVELPYGTEGEKKTYYFDSNYRLKTGWQTINGKKYYFEKEEKPEECYASKEEIVIKAGWQELENGQICYMNSKGAILTGWQTIDKQRYYFDANGVLQTDWFKVGNYWYYGEEKAAEEPKQTIPVGAVAKGIKEIDGKTYVFHTSSYYRLSGWQTISGQRFYLETDGTAKTGWFTLSGKIYYAEEATYTDTVTGKTVYKGTVAKGAKVVDKKPSGEAATETYFFHSSQYYMLTGFQSYNGNRYYLQKDGTAKTGWFTVGTDLYYGEPTTTEEGIMKGTLAAGAKQVGEETYFFHTSSNYRLTGWQTVSGQRYYLDANGKAKTGWFTVGGKIYYGEPETTGTTLKGTLAKGAKTIGNETYVFHTSNYYRLTGWQTVNSQRYYLDTDGTARTGWFTISGKTYYAQPEAKADGTLKGTVAKGLTEITKTYYFHPSQYYMLKGWQTINKERYYFNEDGAMETGWFETGGYNYYAEQDGSVVKGLVDLPYGTEGENKTYYFDNNYRLKTGWYTINGKKYFFTAADSPEECYATFEGSVSYGWMTMENGQICYANSKGAVLTGWQTIGGQRYYFDANGILQTGWFPVGKYQYYAEPKVENGKEQEIPVGAVAKGIKVIGGETYVFHTNSYYMLTGWQTISGQRFYLNADGTAQTGMFKVSSYWYYGEPVASADVYKGTIAKGIKVIGDETYIFHSSQYYRLSGFQSYGGRRYYLKADGTTRTGWFTVGTDLYYGEKNADANGYKGALAAGAKEIDGETYFFHTTSNYRLTGWQSANGQKYYLNADGAARTGWFTISGKTYYGEPEALTDGTLKGGLAKGAREIDGETYVFHTTECNRLTGWQTVGVRKYYLQADGKAKTGWFKQNGYWYYGTENAVQGIILKGAMETAMRKITIQNDDGIVERTYYFDTNYRLSTGWKVVNGIKYFFNIDENPENCYLIYSGLMTSGWFEFENGLKSYFNSQGNAVIGWQTIEGKKYYFDTNGIMQTGWVTISGVDYFFNAYGIYIPMTAPSFASLTTTFYETIDVKWNPVDGVQSYILEYSTNNVFPSWETATVVFNDTTIHEYRAENLEADTTYYFRLRYTTWSDNLENADLYYSPYSAVKSIAARGEVAATATSAIISECQIISGSRDGGITVQLNATLKERIKSADDMYYIVETESYGNAIDLATPVGSFEKDFEIDASFVIDAGDGSDDIRECVDRALMNKFALAILKENGTYQVISEPMGITNPETISENTAPILKPTSKKGLQGIGYDAALDTNSKNTLFNLDLATVVGSGPTDGYVAYEYKGKTYYFSKCSNLVAEFEDLEEGIIQYAQGITGGKNKVCVTLNLLLSYKSSNAYLIDPAARIPGHNYYTLNVREEKARETFEAVFLYLGELFGQSDCYVTHWVLGNEVNSSRAWNYQGSLSFSSYMQVYAAAFRLLYNGVKTAKTGNNVYISLDNGWTSAPDTYAGKTTLDTFAAYAQEENPDMIWSIAYHGYSYPLTRVDFWNDNSNTTFSTSTRYISMKNISVLTDYAAALEQKYEKPEGSIRVILSEQGYTASGKTDVTAEAQARALVRGYYMAEFNDRVDAFIIRAINDDTEEMKGGLYLGLKTYNDIKRITFYTYEFMDSSIEAFASRTPDSIASSSTNQSKVRVAQSIIGGTTWESIIPGFSRSKLAGMY